MIDLKRMIGQLRQLSPLTDSLLDMIVGYLGRVSCLLALLGDSKRLTIEHVKELLSYSSISQDLSCCDQGEFNALLRAIDKYDGRNVFLRSHSQLFIDCMLVSCVDFSCILAFANRCPYTFPSYHALFARGKQSRTEEENVYFLLQTLIEKTQRQSAWRRAWYCLTMGYFGLRQYDFELQCQHVRCELLEIVLETTKLRLKIHHRYHHQYHYSP